MATLNITIDSGQAKTNADTIKTAIYGISNAAKAATGSLQLLEVSLRNAVTSLSTIASSSSAMNQQLQSLTAMATTSAQLNKKLRSDISSNAFVYTKASEKMVGSVNAIGAAVNKNFGDVAMVSKGARGELEKMPKTFVSIDKSASNSIGSVTRFFGQMAIGVFLIGEFVMIFSAAARAISALSKSMDSVETSQITYQFAVLKNQLRDITKNVFSEFSSGIIESMESLNKWIAQNKQDIINFFVDSINNIRNFFNLAKELYNFAEQNPLIKDLGIIGLVAIGVTGKSVLAKLGLIAVALGVISDIYKSIKLMSQDKMTVGEFFSGMLNYDMSKLSDLIKLRELGGESSLTPSQGILYTELKIKAYQDELNALEELRKMQKTPASREYFASVEVKLETVNRIKDLKNLIKDLNEELGILKSNKDSIEPMPLGILSPEFIKAQQEIFKATKIATPDYMAYVKRENQKEYEKMFGNEFIPGLFAGTNVANYGTEKAYKASQAIKDWDTAHAKSMMVYSDSYKAIGYMAEDFYNLQIERENFLHNQIKNSMLSQSEMIAESKRHKEALYQLEIKYLGDILMLQAQQQEVLNKPTNLEKLLGPASGKGGHYALDELTGMETASWIPASVERSIELEAKLTEMRKKRLETTTGMTTANLTLANSQTDLNRTIEISLAQVQLELDRDKARTDAYSHYSQLIGKVLPEAYQEQIEKIDILITEYDRLGLASNVLEEMRKKLISLSNIQFLEGQNDLMSGFTAGLLRLKNEIEPWGKTMADAVVGAAHDMYNAMDDFFFDALEGRMKSFEDYFGGFLSAINKMMAEFLTENLKRGIAQLLPSGEVTVSGGQTGGSGANILGVFGSMMNKPQSGGSGYQISIPNEEWWGQKQGTGPSSGQYVLAGISAAATLYQVYEQSQGISKQKAAATGAVTGGVGGAVSGAAIGAAYGTYGGYYGAAIGLIAGAIMGAVGGHLSGGDVGDKPKLGTGAGFQTNVRYPHTTTPFGLFGFDTAKAIDTNQYKGAMESVKIATKAMASLMSDSMVEEIKEQMSNWNSKVIKGEMDVEHVESLFKNYFKAIGAQWDSGLGNWVADFDGTFDELTQGIIAHVDALKAVEEVFDPTTEYKSAIQDVNDTFDGYIETLEKTGGTVEDLARTEEARAKVLADTNKKFRSEIVDIGMTILDFMGLLDPLDAAIYNIDKMFADWIDRLIQLGATQAEIDLVKSFIPQAKEMAADNLAASYAKMVNDINMATGEMIGIFSALDITTYNLNNQFDAWRIELEKQGIPLEYITELEARRTEAIEQATRTYESSILMLKAQLPGISTSMQKQLTLESLGIKYGIDPSMITGSFIRNIINDIATSNIDLTQDFLEDLKIAYDLFFSPLDNSANNASDALEALRDEAKKLAEEWSKIADQIAQDIERMMFTVDNPQNVLERMGLVRAEIKALGVIDSPKEAERARELYNTLLDLGKEAYQRPTSEYQSVFDEVKSGLEMIGEIAQSQEVVLLQQIADNTAMIIEQQKSGNDMTNSFIEQQRSGNDVIYSFIESFFSQIESRPTDNQSILNFIEALRLSGSGHEWTQVDPKFHIPSFQSGGIHYGTGLAMLHGNEAVIPLHNGVVPVELVGGGETVVHITVQVTGNADAAEVKRKAKEGVLEALKTPEAAAIMRRNQRWNS